MSSVLYRLGRWAYRHRRRVVVIWLLVVLVAGVGAATLNDGTDNTFSIPGTEAGEAMDRLNATFPQAAGTSATYVVVSPEGTEVTDAAVRGPVEDAIAALGKVERVESVADPFGDTVKDLVSDDGRAAIVTAQVDAQSSTVPGATKGALEQTADDLRAALPEGSEVALGGDMFSHNVPGVTITEALGVVIAGVVLFLTFGSFVAAGMPILTALIGVALSTAGIFIATQFATISSTTPLLSLMLGLAVGIDYALFIISRHQGQLREGMDPEESTARALATAGSAVVFAGLTVMIALVGLGVAGIPFLTVMGVAAAAGVGIAVALSLTLTPALLGFAKGRVLPRRRRKAPGEKPHENRFFAGWVRTVTRRPAVTILLVVVGLGSLAIPASRLELALPDAGSQPEGSGPRVAYDLTAEHFGPGFNGPLVVTTTIVGSTDPLGLMADLKEELEQLPGVAAVPLATPNMTADTGIVQVVPETGPDDARTADLVHEIRAQHDRLAQEYGVDIQVTGITAIGVDISARLGGALLPFGILVVGLSFLLLMMVFRSLWVPLKATLGYLLSVVAAFGVVVLVFQDGHFADLLHVDRLGPVISFMPIILMGILFGLAMDYEVFLVSRMREEHAHGAPAREAVRRGFIGSAPVVTAAAAIMFAVFAAFVPEGDSSIKPIALGLAVGIFVDAFIVRMTLVPAVLHLLGERAWRMPHRLERALPSFDVEGEGLARELALADWPEPGATDAISAEGLRLDDEDRPFYADVAFRVPAGGTLVVAGPHRSGRTPLLLTLAGRVHADEGKLKVLGLPLPVRAGSVRRRVAVARLWGATDAVATVREALAWGTPVVVLDDLGSVSDPGQRAVVGDLLSAAHAAGTTLVVSCLDTADLNDLVPRDGAVVLVLPEPEAPRGRPDADVPTLEVTR